MDSNQKQKATETAFQPVSITPWISMLVDWKTGYDQLLETIARSERNVLPNVRSILGQLDRFIIFLRDEADLLHVFSLSFSPNQPYETDDTTSTPRKLGASDASFSRRYEEGSKAELPQAIFFFQPFRSRVSFFRSRERGARRLVLASFYRSVLRYDRIFCRSDRIDIQPERIDSFRPFHRYLFDSDIEIIPRGENEEDTG